MLVHIIIVYIMDLPGNRDCMLTVSSCVPSETVLGKTMSHQQDSHCSNAPKIPEK